MLFIEVWLAVGFLVTLYARLFGYGKMRLFSWVLITVVGPFFLAGYLCTLPKKIGEALSNGFRKFWSFEV